MSKPVTPQEMFDLWQKMVNPGAYPLQSLMFPVLDPKELEKRISELEVVEHWLRANLNMLQLSIRSLEFQRDLLEGGDKARAAATQGAQGDETANPAMWAWNLMAQAGKDAMESAAKAAKAQAPEPSKPRRKKKKASR
jgi:hypothetical protein